MFVLFSQLQRMSKDELWRLASNYKTANPIRRAAMHQWIELERNSYPYNEVAARARLRSQHNSGYPA